MAIKPSVTDAPHFHDEHAAIARLEAILWPNGPICPHCENTDKIYAIKGKSARPGLKTCGKCRKQFTVKVGSLFEDSPIPMRKWWQAVHLLCSGKKGVSSHELHRVLKVTYKTAWFMSHRIREAMRVGPLAPPSRDRRDVYRSQAGSDRAPGPSAQICRPDPGRARWRGAKLPCGARGPSDHTSKISTEKRRSRLTKAATTRA